MLVLHSTVVYNRLEQILVLHLPVCPTTEIVETKLDFCNLAGTPEAGGWTSREVKRIIRGLAGLNFV